MINLTNMFGWLGTILLTVCSFPQLMLTWRKRQVKGLSLAMLWLWLFGLFFMIIFVWNTTKQTILYYNYGLDLLVVIAILWGYYRAARFQKACFKNRRKK